MIGTISPDPFTERLGITSYVNNEGIAITTHESIEDECNIFGVVHGALLFAMADVGMGMTLTSVLPGKQRVGSLSITSNYIRAGRPGRLEARSKLLNRGRSVAFLQSEIRDESGEICANFSGIFHIYEGKRKSHGQ